MALESFRDELRTSGLFTREKLSQGRRFLRRFDLVERVNTSLEGQLGATVEEWNDSTLRAGDLMALGQDAHNPLQPTHRRTGYEMCLLFVMGIK